MELEGMEDPSAHGSPSIVIAAVEDGDHQQVSPRTTAGVHDWQMVEDDSLSQCGSSPSSLSQGDLDSLETVTPVAEASKEEDDAFAEEGIEADSGAPNGDTEDGEAAVEAHSTEKEILPTSSQPEVAVNSDTEDQEQEVVISDVQTGEAIQDDDLQSDGATDEEASLEESAASDDDPESYLSTHSSYANVSMADGQSVPSDTVNQDLVDSLSASVISEMIAAANADGELPSEAEVASETEENPEEPSLPDNGVFSIATGYPLESLLFSGRRASGDALRFPSMDFDVGSAMSSQSSASFASTAADSLPLPGPQPHIPEASKWRAWLSSSGNGRASKFLHRIWFQLQMVARRAGACIPYSLRKRVAGVLKCLDAQAAKGARTSVYLAYGAAFVGFLLALRYYRECRRLRQINIAQKDAFDMHVLKVLDLNEKLGRGMNIPITHNCGFKDLSFAKRGYSYRPVGLTQSFLTSVP